MEERIKQLENKIAMIEQDKQISNFDNSLEYITFKNIVDFIEIISTVPTHTPKGLYEQIKFYSDSGTYRLYVYNYVDNVWRYATLT